MCLLFYSLAVTRHASRVCLIATVVLTAGVPREDIVHTSAGRAVGSTKPCLGLTRCFVQRAVLWSLHIVIASMEAAVNVGTCVCASSVGRKATRVLTLQRAVLWSLEEAHTCSSPR